MFKRFWLFEERLRALVRHIASTRLAGAKKIKERQRWQVVATNRKEGEDSDRGFGRAVESLPPIRAMALERGCRSYNGLSVAMI